MLLIVDQKVVKHHAFPLCNRASFCPSAATAHRAYDLWMDAIHELDMTRHNMALRVFNSDKFTIPDALLRSRLPIHDNVISERIGFAHFIEKRIIIAAAPSMDYIAIGEGNQVIFRILLQLQYK